MSFTKLKPETLLHIKEFAGDISMDQLRYVDCFSANHMVMFIPMAGPCLQAVSPMHTHPAHMFVVNFSDTTSIVLRHSKYRAQPNMVAYLPPLIPHHEA